MAENLISPGIAITETDQSAVAARPVVVGAALVGPTVKGPVNVPVKVTSYREYVRTFGTTFSAVSGGIPVQREFLTSMAAKSYFEQNGESLLVVRVAKQGAFTPATATVKTSLVTESIAADSFRLYTLTEGDLMNSGIVTGSDGNLISGSSDNLRFDVTSVNGERGTFSLTIRRGDDTDVNPIILENYNNLSLDPESENYIERVIGDQYSVVVKAGDETYIDVRGNYPNKSAYVRVKVLTPTPGYLSTDGTTVASGSWITGSVSGSASYQKLLPTASSGGFTGATGIVGACYSNSSSVDTSGVALYFEDLKTTPGTSEYNQTVKDADYDIAIDLLANTDEYQFKMISAPGYFKADNLIGLAQERGEAIAIVDLGACSAGVTDVTSTAKTLNSSYGSTYYPWLQLWSATGKLEWCPASVVIPGMYTNSDKSTAPWYAPAGASRGRIAAVQARKKLTKDMRDTLYDANVNPIATMPGAGLVAYGQKTLQRKASALDRVNVRRLMIELKQRIREMASGLLFEQNTQALQNAFRARLDSYLASVLQSGGVYAYQISLDGNTPEAIDRNEFHAAIAIQPTKVIEYIYLDFTITSTGVEFN